MSRFSQEKHKLSIVETTGRRARSGNLWLCFHLENLGNLCSETTREELGVFDSQQQGCPAPVVTTARCAGCGMGKGSSSRAPSQNTTHHHDGGWQILLFIFYSSKKQQEMKLLEKTTSLVLLFLTSTPTRNECCGFGRSGIIMAKTFCCSQLRRRRIEPGFSPTPRKLLVGAREREKLPRVGFVPTIHLKKTFAQPL